MVSCFGNVVQLEVCSRPWYHEDSKMHLQYRATCWWICWNEKTDTCECWMPTSFL